MSEALEQLRFLTEEQVRGLAGEFDTPLFVYSEEQLKSSASAALAFPNAFGLTVRYAMKANPLRAILKVFDKLGLHIDASSGYEAERAILAGISPDKILITSQRYPRQIEKLIQAGVKFNAGSLKQLELFGAEFPGAELGLRFNPGVGSGGTNRTNVGGEGASFGIWHEHLEQVKAAVKSAGLKVVRIHTHIGSGSDPAVWQRVAELSIDLVSHFPDAKTLNLGGGFKVGRMQGEGATDFQKIGEPVVKVFKDFAAETGRELKLEIEPGTSLVANVGSLIAEVTDVVNTGKKGYEFYKLDAGMTDILRPSLYGAQHPLIVVGRSASSAETTEALVVGHCCESGDILTPSPGDPEGLAPRKLAAATPGDYLVVEGVGAYCSSMSAKNYNSYPEAAEVILRSDGTVELIKKRETLEQVLANEL